MERKSKNRSVITQFSGSGGRGERKGEREVVPWTFPTHPLNIDTIG